VHAGHKRVLVGDIDPFDLCIGHVEDDPIALTAELQTPLDAINMINMREQPGFGRTIVVTVFFEDDGH